VLPAVVNIAVTETVSGGDMLGELPPELRDTPLGREFRRKFGNRREQVAGAGSGFIIDSSGIIVTNNHVVTHADRIVVALTDGRRFPARVLGRDEINPGNSGGPVFNMDGQVIGVSSVIVSPTGASVGIGFAIPSDTVSRIVTQLLSHGSIERGWLGVSVDDRDEGVTIASLDRAGPAGRAGIRPGDVVVAVNGEHIDSSRGLIRTIAGVPPGNNVRLTVRRMGREIEIPVTVGRRPTEQQAG
jgi:S1-C subfamily serine protease